MATPETTAIEPANDVSTFAAIGDTIRMPWSSATNDDDLVVRPALAVLYRIALGPSADRYVPRFLEYERTGRSVPGWHAWAFLAPPAWAFYRKLWVAGAFAALLPLVGLGALVAMDPLIPDGVEWFAAAAMLVWVLPAAGFAIFANALLHRRVKRVVADAEAASASAHEVASAVAKAGPTALAGALAGVGVLAATLAVALSVLQMLHAERAVRAGVEEALAAMRPLQREIEDGFLRLRAMPQPEAAALAPYLGATAIDAVSVSAATGRLRLTFGPALPELAGRIILLVPVQDAAGRVEWLCVPVGIAARHLPSSCRGR